MEIKASLSMSKGRQFLSRIHSLLPIDPLTSAFVRNFCMKNKQKRFSVWMWSISRSFLFFRDIKVRGLFSPMEVFPPLFRSPFCWLTISPVLWEKTVEATVFHVLFRHSSKSYLWMCESDCLKETLVKISVGRWGHHLCCCWSLPG